jgi:hypothetical protein
VEVKDAWCEPCSEWFKSHHQWESDIVGEKKVAEKSIFVIMERSCTDGDQHDTYPIGVTLTLAAAVRYIEDVLNGHKEEGEREWDDPRNNLGKNPDYYWNIRVMPNLEKGGLDSKKLKQVQSLRKKIEDLEKEIKELEA